VTPTEYARVKEIFDQAVDVPDEKRDQLVRLCCGEDTLIRDEVMSLLRFHRLGTILATDTVDLPLGQQKNCGSNSRTANLRTDGNKKMQHDGGPPTEHLSPVSRVKAGDHCQFLFCGEK